jgi:hypothetical protein
MWHLLPPYPIYVKVDLPKVRYPLALISLRRIRTKQHALSCPQNPFALILGVEQADAEAAAGTGVSPARGPIPSTTNSVQVWFIGCVRLFRTYMLSLPLYIGGKQEHIKQFDLQVVVGCNHL